MGYETAVILGLIGLGIVILALLNVLDDRKTVRDLDRFEKSFPGKCPICSFRRYGMLHGFDPGIPVPHRCPDEVTRTESNRLPGQRYWTGPRDRKIVRIDVGQMTTEQAEGAVLVAKDILSKPVLPPIKVFKESGW